MNDRNIAVDVIAFNAMEMCMTCRSYHICNLLFASVNINNLWCINNNLKNKNNSKSEVLLGACIIHRLDDTRHLLFASVNINNWCFINAIPETFEMIQ